ncbi:MAG TPA: amidohydrolase family protein, partial [Thermomicrobiales bacterium]|nr:amidohydrolase family protein [Thermomicrobiales bacterium]
EVEALWGYIRDETIDFVCSDHVGIPIALKRAGDRDTFAAPLGVTGAQTLLPVFWHEAVTKRRMSPSHVVRLLSTNPAQIFGFHPRKGTIRVGADADLALFDPRSEWTIRNTDMLYQHPWTPFDGRTITGLPVRTIRRGETIYDAENHGNPDAVTSGTGRYIPRGYGANGR